MILYVVIISLVTFLVGYSIGKRQGREIGYHEAESVMPLKLRQQSFEAGKCVICNEFWTKTSNYEIFSRDLNT